MAAPRLGVEVAIAGEDLTKLMAIARSRTEPASRVERARMLLAYRDDPSFFAVGRLLGVHHQTVQRCIERAASLGPLAALDDSARPGKTATITAVDRGDYGDALEQAGADLVVRSLAELLLTPNGAIARKALSGLPLFSDRRDEIRNLLSGKAPVVFLDYDGTLTPIVEDYTKAFLPADMRAAVAALGKHCTVAVVSGRDVQTVRGLVNLEDVYYAGSHGFEIRGPEGRSENLEKGLEFLPDLDAAERRLRERLASIAGHAVERKRFSIAVHYRRAADSDVARIESAVDEVLSDCRRLHKGHGKKVFRILPNIGWNKGHAVLWMLERLKPGHGDVLPLYIGDDITDEDAFQALAGRGLSLVVRDPNDRPTAADYALADTADVKCFLEFLTALTSGHHREP
jgi:trehalose-phosphatase